MTVDNTQSDPISLGPVLKAELAEIEAIRNKRSAPGKRFNRGIRSTNDRPAVAPGATELEPAPGWQKTDTDWVTVIAKAHQANLVGLAFSGGGIRSATFNLGVLQALADLELLHRMDYLSTVSGGGYIGGWLAAWTKRAGSFAQVQKGLAVPRVLQQDDKEPEQIRFLRVFSNYLTPKVGFFSADTWCATAIIVRNILLNLTVLLASLVTLLMVPRVVVELAGWMQPLVNRNEGWLTLFLAFLLLIPLIVTMINMVYVDSKTRSQWTRQGLILALVAGPLFLSTLLASLWQTKQFEDWHRATQDGAIAYEIILLVATVIGVLAWKLRAGPKKLVEDRRAGEIDPQKKEKAPWGIRDTAVMLASALPTGALAGWMCGELLHYMNSWDVGRRLTFAAPMVLAVLLLSATFHIGLMGIEFPDRRREWCARLGGWLLLGGLMWLAVLYLALYFPHLVTLLSPPLRALATKYLTAAWIVSTAGGVLAGNSKATGEQGSLNWKDWLAKAAPSIFVVGLICWLSWGIDYFLNRHQYLYTTLIGCIVIAAVMAWRVDINQFSLHQMYRNRLVSCYLGASNTGRAPNRFTGLDRTDELALRDLRHAQGYDGPFPIFNSALNLVKGQDLAWQERKAESFVMTPLHCGYDVWLEDQDSPMLRGERQTGSLSGDPVWGKNLKRFGYRDTEEYAFSPPRGKGLYLGTAMGISGAAASPNMGFYSSTPVAFLMTVFNVRLGQWLGNPRHAKTWKRPTPRFGLTYLLNELFAGTTDEADYVYLSDGGHFDNMGLYELVKRRCGLIILCDAEADVDYQYTGLGNAIRKCRTDMGVDIDLDVGDITPQEQGKPGKRHCAVGTIHYENADINAPLGTIIYIKASLTGDEPTDIQNYKKVCSTFPHESTIDQWFSESQFESYRKLGYHAVYSSIASTSKMAQQRGSSWWSAAATTVSEVLKSLDDRDRAHERSVNGTSVLTEELRKILEEFGFYNSSARTDRPAKTGVDS
jgi:hypothetical protein